MPIPEKVPAGSFAACFPKEATTVEDFHDLVARLTIYYDQERVRCQELEDENALLHRFVQELKEGQQAASKEINKPLQGVPFDQTLSGSSNYRYSTLSGSFQGQTLEESRALTDDAQEHDFRGPRGRESTSDPGSHEIQLRQSKSLISEQSELSLLQVWTQEVRPKSRRSADDLASIPRMKSVSSIGSFTSGFEDVLPREGLRSGDVLYEKSCIQQFMLNPNSWVSVLWDFVTVLFVFYDLITLPLQVFNLQSGVLSTGDLLVAITWTLDIVVSFLRGVTDRGAVDMRPTYVAMKYLRSWFLLDLFVVVTDWILLLSGGLEDMEVLRVLRGRIFLRLLRVLRLVRLIKVADRSSIIRLKEAILNDHNKAVSSVLQLLFVVVMINHYVGCGWFAVGQVEGFDKSWVSEHLTGEGDQHVLSQYLTSVHWAVTQFTPAAMEVVPVNSAERMYAIVVIFSGLVMFSSFVSSMTSAMDLINKLNFEQRQKSTALRQYITENRVSLELLFCIQNYQRSMRALEPKKLHECDVVLFKNLPEDLLQRLHSEVYGPVIAMHPLFGHLQGKEDSMMLGICHLAMSERSLVIGEELFRYGTPGSKMYFIVSGTVAYFSGYSEKMPKLVPANQWMCEPVLWCKWEHRGRLTVATPQYLRMFASQAEKSMGPLRGELMVLDAAEFHAIISRSRVISSLQAYARVFTAMAVKDCGGAAEVDDLWGSYEQVSTCLRRAFGFGEEAEAASRFKMLWDVGENHWKHCFVAWKQAAWEEHERRKTRGSKRSSLLWSVWRLRWLTQCGRRCRRSET